MKSRKAKPKKLGLAGKVITFYNKKEHKTE